MKWYLISLGILVFLIVLPFIVVEVYFYLSELFDKDKKKFYTLEELKEKWRKEAQHWWYPVIDFFKKYRLFIIKSYWNIRNFFQKLIKGYSDNEVIDMSYYLAKWMVKRLPDYIEARKKYDNDKEVKQEIEELQSILYFFQSVVKEYNLEEEKIDREKYELGKNLVSKYIDELYL